MTGPAASYISKVRGDLVMSEMVWSCTNKSPVVSMRSRVMQLPELFDPRSHPQECIAIGCTAYHKAVV